MEKSKKVKPKQYTHIDYEALLIYIMKNNITVDKALEVFGLDIARSTVIRNIRKLKEQNKGNEIISLYQKKYVPNMQSKTLPIALQEKIDLLPNKPVIIQDKLEVLYNKLYCMKQIIDSCGGNLSEATRLINSGTTILGNVKISRQGLGKNMSYYEKVKEEYEKTRNKKEQAYEGR